MYQNENEAYFRNSRKNLILVLSNYVNWKIEINHYILTDSGKTFVIIKPLFVILNSISSYEYEHSFNLVNILYIF